MTEQNRPEGMLDRVQIFSMAQAAGAGAALATSPNSNIVAVRVPAGEATRIEAQESDRILVLLRGECSVDSPSGKRRLDPQQGMLIPAGVVCHLENDGRGDAVFFSMQTKRAAALVANTVSDVRVNVPVEYLDAKGIGSRIYAYTIDRCTIGLSPLIMEEWNQVSAVRMNCKYERVDDQVVATLPQRLVEWYGIADLTDGDYTLRPDRTRTRVRVNITPFVERKARLSLSS